MKAERRRPTRAPKYEVRPSDLLLRTIPMHNLHPVLCFAQTFAYLLRNHDRAMLPTGAAKGDGQVALAFPGCSVAADI